MFKVKRRNLQYLGHSLREHAFLDSAKSRIGKSSVDESQIGKNKWFLVDIRVFTHSF